MVSKEKILKVSYIGTKMKTDHSPLLQCFSTDQIILAIFCRGHPMTITEDFNISLAVISQAPYTMFLRVQFCFSYL